MFSKTMCAIPVVFVLSAAAFAQTAQPPAPAAQPPAIKTRVEEVLLDIIVRDKKGKPITDIGPDDLIIQDNGVRQKITSFRLVQGTEAINQQGARTALDPLRQIRLVTLAFEDMGNEQRQIARRAAADLIKGEQGTNVFYSVVAIMGRLQILQPFTADKEALRKAVERATSGVSSSQLTTESERIKGQLRDTLRQATGQADQAAALRALDTGANVNPQAAGAGGALGNQALNLKLVQVSLDMLRMDAAMNENSRLSLAALQSLVSGLAPLPGRKSILYFTWGIFVPPHLDEPFRSLLSMANRANVTFYSVDTNGVMTWSQNSSSNNQMAQAARGSADTVTKIGAVTVDQVMAADRAETSMRNNTQNALRNLAESTGGFLIGDSNDLRTPLRQVNEEISSYYEVTYNPGVMNYDGSFRRVKVETDRKNAVLHARNGYFALPPDLRSAGLQPFELPLLKVLSEQTLPRDLDFRAGLVRFRSTAQGVSTAVLIEVPIGNLTFREDKEKNQFSARLSLVALIKDSSGAVVQKFTRDLPLQGTLDKLAGVKSGNFIYKEMLSLPAGRYTLEAAVIDRETNRTSATRGSYELNGGKGVGISSISLVRTYQPNAKDLDPDDPFQFQGGRITPTLSPAIKAEKGAALSMFFVVYPDSANSAKPAVEIEYLKDGQVVGKGSLELPAPDAQGRIPYVMSSDASAMPPGDYTIQATVKQGQETARDKTSIKVEM